MWRPPQSRASHAVFACFTGLNALRMPDEGKVGPKIYKPCPTSTLQTKVIGYYPCADFRCDRTTFSHRQPSVDKGPLRVRCHQSSGSTRPCNPRLTRVNANAALRFLSNQSLNEVRQKLSLTCWVHSQAIFSYSVPLGHVLVRDPIPFSGGRDEGLPLPGPYIQGYSGPPTAEMPFFLFGILAPNREMDHL